jgi:K+-transporting ATPase ATPase A chain
MTFASVALIAVFLLTVAVCIKPLGIYIANVMEPPRPETAQRPPMMALRLGAPIERLFYRMSGINADEEMTWKQYALALLAFNTLGLLLLYLLQRVQVWLPFNPQNFDNVSADSSFNTAVSFVTNTNWQGYAGESTMSYFTQMAGLAVQNFLSAATGTAVVIALIRGLARNSAKTIGNFWADVTRATLYILLPLSVVLAIVLASQGVLQNLSAYKEVSTLEPVTFQQAKIDAAGQPVVDAQGNPITEAATATTQTLPMGPIASQEAIKELGTNGGGFLNANSAHPFENPNALTNFLEMLALFVIPTALTYTFGRMIGDTRQGWAVLAAMALMLVTLLALATYNEQLGNPKLATLGVDQAASMTQPGGNMEGKEARYGIGASALFATVTTATSTGAVNTMHDSLTPLGGFVALFQMQLGEVIPGGVGSGLYSMLIFAIIGVFIAGLMIGRTPEYLGKKIESFEVKMASIAILVMPIIVLVGTAVAVSVASGKAGVANPGAHGFSEVLYAFTSAGNNNGSAFAGLSANTPFYNAALGLVMWLGRFWPIVAILAIAGSLAAKKRLPVTPGTMPTHGPTFVILLIGTVLLVGALTFVPALALGPVVEHLMLWQV